MKHLIHVQITDVAEFVTDNHVFFVLEVHYTVQLIGLIRKASPIPEVLLIMTFVIEEFIQMLLALILVSITCLAKI